MSRSVRTRPLRCAAIDVLMVCTGNICRSPMAEALLRAHLHERGIDAHVHSAGTMAWDSTPPDEAITAMKDHGLDVSGHRSRQLVGELLERADLVLGMTRQHTDRVDLVLPDAAPRTFLVGELVRLGRQVGARRPDEDVTAWLARVHEARAHARFRGRGTDEIADPIGAPLATYQATAARLDAELREVAALLAGEG